MKRTTGRQFWLGAGRDGRRRGSAMLVVLWAILIMSLSVSGFLHYAGATVRRDVTETKEREARLWAESGLALAAHPGLRRGDPALRQEAGAQRGFEVRVSTEGTRWAVLQVAADPVLAGGLREQLVRWGLDPEAALEVVDSLADWMDGDDTERPRGAERDYYARRGFPQYPRNTGFRSLQEMRLVRGMERLAELRPDWDAHFSLYGDGTVDVNEAGTELLELRCGIDPEAALRVVQQRRGPDELDHTWDDTPFTTLGAVREAMGLGIREFRGIEARLTLAHPVRRVESRGWAGDVSKTLVAILGGGHRDLLER